MSVTKDYVNVVWSWTNVGLSLKPVQWKKIRKNTIDRTARRKFNVLYFHVHYSPEQTLLSAKSSSPSSERAKWSTCRVISNVNVHWEARVEPKAAVLHFLPRRKIPLTTKSAENWKQIVTTHRKWRLALPWVLNTLYTVDNRINVRMKPATHCQSSRQGIKTRIILFSPCLWKYGTYITLRVGILRRTTLHIFVPKKVVTVDPRALGQVQYSRITERHWFRFGCN